MTVAFALSSTDALRSSIVGSSCCHLHSMSVELTTIDMEPISRPCRTSTLARFCPPSSVYSRLLLMC